MGLDPIVIVSAARTPIGAFNGDFKDIPAHKLGAVAIKAALERAGIPGAEIDEVFVGNVLTAGQGQAPGRQAALGAGLPYSVPVSTLNKVCGSGLKAVMLANDLITAGSITTAIAAGQESMTNAPYLLDKARGGFRAGHGKIYDHMFLDGLEDAYDRGKAMGVFAEDTAEAYQFTREQQDKFALASLERAQTAIKEGKFAREIVAVTAGKAGEITTDESPGKARPEKIPTLRPVFREGGTVTAANSSGISDGAAALVITRLSEAERRGLTPRAIIRGHASHSQEPKWFTTAPVGAIKKLLEKLSWAAADVDLYEINEAFAVVTMAAMHDLNLAHEKVNVHGGACALGHPIGASGARILVTLLEALETYGLKTGVASLCIGGGEGVAVAIERV